MSKEKKQTSGQKGRESVFQEAWKNMNEDFNRLIPKRFRNKEKKKFVLWLFILEVLVLGVIGRFVYFWLTG